MKVKDVLVEGSDQPFRPAQRLPYGQPFNPNFGGLNRDVTLHICDQLHQTLPLYRNLGTVGTYVYPTNIDTLNKTAGLTMPTQVENDYQTTQKCRRLRRGSLAFFREATSYGSLR